MLAEIIPHLPARIPEVNQTLQWLFTTGQIPPLVLAVVLAVRWSREHGTLIPLLFLAGGLIAMFNEPIVDHNGLVWFPTEGQWTLYTTFGIAQPIWLAMAYLWFFGGQPMVIWRALEKGLPARSLWKAFGLVVLVDIVLEHPGLYANLFLYYGHQPFKFTRFPLWWGVVNATTPIVAATLVHLLRRELRGWKVLGVLLLVPIVQAATNAGTGFPIWNTINTRLPWPVVWSAGLASIGLCLYVVWLCTVAVGRLRASGDGAEIATEDVFRPALGGLAGEHDPALM
jgi:hypothetical protein